MEQEHQIKYLQPVPTVAGESDRMGKLTSLTNLTVKNALQFSNKKSTGQIFKIR